MRVARRTSLIIAMALGVAAPASAQTFRDSRTHTLRPLTQPQRALRGSLGLDAVVESDATTGTPRMVLRLDGFLTGPSPAAPDRVALAYVRDHAAAFGLSTVDLAQFRLTRAYKDIGGTTHLEWRQSYRGVPAFDNGLRAAVTRDGRLLNVGGSPRHRLLARSLDPRLGAAAALGRALRAGNSPLVPAAITHVGDGAQRRTAFAGGGSAGLVLFGTARGSRLAWEVVAGTDRTVVDARSGRILWQASLVQDLARGTAWEYFPSPLVPNGGNQLRMHDFTRWNTSPTALRGSYAHVYPDTNDDDAPDTPTTLCPECGEVAPNAAGPTWSYPFHPFYNASGHCSTAIPCSWTTDTPFSWRTNLRRTATQVYYYVNKYHDHLLAPPIGFSPAAGNFEGVDAVRAEIDDGADTAPVRGYPDEDHISNANMFVPPDGRAPRMQMYLFTARTTTEPTPDVNGGDEADVVYHEYTHGLSQRLVTDARGNPALDAQESGAMGEGWSDWYALDYVNAEGYAPDGPAVGDFTMYYFVSGGNPRAMGVRTEPMDCLPGAPRSRCPGSRRAGPGGYTLGDYGKICACGTEVHADGEIWGQTLWQLRQQLGSVKTESLVTRGLELTPPQPSYLDARNGIVQADVANYGGADLPVIWRVFASRGMGFYAAVIDGEDAHPVQSFRGPPAAGLVGAVRGVVRDADTHRPVPRARVYIGGHRELAAITDRRGRYVIRIVPIGRYPELIVRRADYDLRVLKATVRATSNRKNILVSRDWAAIASHVAILRVSRPNLSEFGCGPAEALDGKPTTGWLSASVRDPDFPGPKVLALRLRKRITLTGFVLSGGAPCVGDARAALGKFRIDVSRNGRVFVRAAGGRLRRADVAVRIRAPRLRGVRFVRLTMLGSLGRSPYLGVTEFSVHGR